jgi:hypothetical protein
MLLKYVVRTAVKMPVVVLWFVMLCRLVGGNKHFEGTYGLHLYGPQGLQGLERTLRRWQDNIKTDHRETGYDQGGSCSGWALCPLAGFDVNSVESSGVVTTVTVVLAVM